MRFSLKSCERRIRAEHHPTVVCPPRFGRAEGGRGGGGLGMGAALGEDDPDKVLPLYSDDAVLWGTLSPTVRADRAALRDYFVTAFRVLPGLKVAFGDQLIRVYGGTAVNTGYYTFSYVKDGEPRACPRATASLTSRAARTGSLSTIIRRPCHGPEIASSPASAEA